MAAAWTFADILAPIGEDEFFAEYFDRQPLHIPGDPDKFADVMNWGTLNSLLNMTAVWGPQSMTLVQDRETIPAPRYCREAIDREGRSALQPDAAQVMAFLQQGASLVANDIDTMTAEMRAVADALEAATTSKVQSNLYCSWKQRQAFTSHFDTHDVFAFHTEGEKTWRIYETRMPHPIRHPAFTYSEAEHERQRGDVLMEVRLTPGDLLYIPRGWYHDALASSEASLHITFGITGLVGLDVVSALYDAALHEEAFRINLPRAADGREALKSRLDTLADRLRDIAKSDAFLDAFVTSQGAFRMPRGGFDLPLSIPDIEYRVTRSDFRVERQGGTARLAARNGTVPIPQGLDRPVEWVVARTSFARSELIDAFPDFLIQDMDGLLRNLAKMNVITRRHDDAA